MGRWTRKEGLIMVRECESSNRRLAENVKFIRHDWGAPPTVPQTGGQTAQEMYRRFYGKKPGE